MIATMQSKAVIGQIRQRGKVARTTKISNNCRCVTG